jgi:hypothetical protein
MNLVQHVGEFFFKKKEQCRIEVKFRISWICACICKMGFILYQLQFMLEVIAAQ